MRTDSPLHTKREVIYLHAASASDMFLIYKFEFPRFKATKNKRKQTPSFYVIPTRSPKRGLTDKDVQRNEKKVKQGKNAKLFFNHGS